MVRPLTQPLTQPEPPRPRYRVTLTCPTPLAHPSLEVEADDPEKAKLAFYAANGICDSKHPMDIKRVQ